MRLDTLVLEGLLVALAAMAILVVVRLVRVVRRGRALARFQREATSIARRLLVETGPLARILDDLRRRSTDPAILEAHLRAAMPALRHIAEDARTGLHPPRGLEPLSAALAGEASRAVRSAELAETAAAALLDPRAARDAESGTALKRSALNLRNATDEAGRIAARIGDLRPRDLERPGAAAGSVATASLPSYGSPDDDLPIGA